MSSILQLKVFLTTGNRQDDPGIYRRIQICDDINFYELHCMLQLAMGWCGVGSFEFSDFYDPEDIICNNFDNPTGYYGLIYDSKGYKIKGFLRHNSLTCYEYTDEEDNNWRHVIFVEDVLIQEAGKTYPICLEGKRNSPAEAFGGWHGYKALVKGKGKLYDKYLNLFGSPYYPEHFDITAINAQLAGWKQFKKYWLDINRQLHPGNN